MPKPVKQHHLEPDESVKREHMKFNTAAEVNDIKENNESENQTAVVTGQDTEDKKQEVISSKPEITEKDTTENQDKGMY